MSYEVIKATSIYKRSSIVPLIGDLAPRSRVYGHILCFFFLGKKHMSKKKKQLPQNRIPPPRLYTHMCTLYTYEFTMCRDLVHLVSSGPPGVVSTPALTSEYPICSVGSRPQGSHRSTPYAVCISV